MLDSKLTFPRLHSKLLRRDCSSIDESQRVGPKRIALRRPGVTILEVMFAIFVVIVGLMGIASLIPLAARNAEDSNAQNNALTQGKIWLNDFFTRGMNDHDSFATSGTGFNWQWRNDVTVPVLTYDYKKGVPPVTPNPAYLVAPTNSKVTSAPGVRIWPHQSVCIDPVFMSDPAIVRRFNDRSGNFSPRVGSYRASVFPYYEDGHNPTDDGFASTAPWPDQPRMIRLTLGGSGGSIPNKLVKDIFFSRDDLSILINDKDKTIPAQRVFSEGSAKALTTGDYTWMATLSPEPLTAFIPASSPGASVNKPTRDYTMSLVIFQRRDRQFIDKDTTPGLVDNKPAGERLVWVHPLSGDFRGGTGGRVRLISNKNVEDRVHVGDWIMLGKHYLIDGSVTPAHRYSYFRWFRIIAVDTETRINELRNVVPAGSDPFGNNAGALVWTRDVVLEGPDWVFYSTPDPTGATLGTQMVNGAPVPTTGALIQNVVTVIERNVRVD